MNRYKITSRDGWEPEMAKRFGKEGSIHALTDEQVVGAILNCGRAAIEIASNPAINDHDFVLAFENGYD